MARQLTMNREEHLQWCKDRALEYVDANDLQNAMASMMSDIGKHRETADHAGIELGMGLMMLGNLDSPAEMRNWITGFN